VPAGTGPLVPIPPGRGIYTNRTLNLRTVRAIGYDMDYTLVHYDPQAWEAAAYRHLRAKLAERGWAVGELTFDPAWIIRGLIVDRHLGNLVKANRFGYVKQATHGTRMLDFQAQREIYANTTVELGDGRFYFLNTLFSLSEALMYAQLVDMLDGGALAPEVLGYVALHDMVRSGIDAAHMEGHLKREIVANPDRFVVLDPEAPLALLDQKRAGKQLLLITNSDWPYTRFMMAYAFDRFLPRGLSWRDLFDLVLVSAHKPDFFAGTAPLLHVLNDAGHLSSELPASPRGQVYFGGSAPRVEALLGLSGADILYVGDHIYADVHSSKSVRRWRTALVLRELEGEIAAEQGFAARRHELEALMAEKERLEARYDGLRLARQRAKRGYGPPLTELSAAQLTAAMSGLRRRLMALDERIAPLAQASAELDNPRWGLILRTGNDKSYLTRQLERHADVYTSRVSNFLYATPFAYLRSHRGALPHDADVDAGDSNSP
jgi:HAD superfamily 5'-nucleotidase-like hydrolase